MRWIWLRARAFRYQMLTAIVQQGLLYAHAWARSNNATVASTMNLNYIIFYLQSRLWYQNCHRNHLISLYIGGFFLSMHEPLDRCKPISIVCALGLCIVVAQALWWCDNQTSESDKPGEKVVVNCIKAQIWFNETRLTCVTFFFTYSI